MSERYQFDAKDHALIRAAITLLKKVARAEGTKPAQLVSVAKLQHVLSLLPRAVSGIDVRVSLSSPRRNFPDEIETMHWWEVAAEGSQLSISSGGHFFRPSTGGDSFTTMRWAAIPEDASELNDYRESLWMVPHVLWFPDGVDSIDFASGGYAVEVTDDDNPLLEDDMGADEAEPHDETGAQGHDGEASGDEHEPVQQMFSPEDKPESTIELYRRDEMIETSQKDWHRALLIFQQMGWQPARSLEAYAHPLTFIAHDDGEEMQRAGRSLLVRIQDESLVALMRDEPLVPPSVQMDLGLLYKMTEFVGGGAFIVGRRGAYKEAKANDF